MPKIIASRAGKREDFSLTAIWWKDRPNFGAPQRNPFALHMDSLKGSSCHDLLSRNDKRSFAILKPTNLTMTLAEATIRGK